jgi:hypothetical protein
MQAGDTARGAKTQRLEERIQSARTLSAPILREASAVWRSPTRISPAAIRQSLMRNAGLEVHIDAAGNIIGRRAGTIRACP